MTQSSNGSTAARARFLDGLTLVMLIVPILARIEVFARPADSSYFLKDFLIEGLTILTVLPSLGVIIILGDYFRALVVAVLVFLVALCVIRLAVHPRRRKYLLGKIRSVFLFAAYAFVGCAGCSFWFYLTS